MDSSGDSDPLTPRHDDSYATVSSAPPKRRAGRTKFHETRHPVYKGVRRRNNDRWVCEVREPNKKSRIWLGTFPTAETAARAHDIAAIALRGRAACLNFADSAWLLPVPESSSPRDIQRAAAKVVDMFGPTATTPAATEGPSSSSTTPTADREAFFMDDGMSLGMEGYYDMAQGMLIDPPPMTGSEAESYDAGEAESYDAGEAESYDAGEMSLWDYSF